MKKYSLIVSAKAKLKEIEQFYELQRYFPDVCDEIYVSRDRKDAKKFASYASKESDYITVVGENNLMHDAIGGVASEVPLLYIPTGKCDDLGYHVGYHGNLRQYIEECLAKDAVAQDVYRFNSEYFTYLAAGGYSMHILYSILDEDKERYGMNAYLKAFAREMTDFQKIYPVQFQLDHVNFTRNCTGVFFYNHNEDHRLGVFILKRAPKLLILSELSEVFKGERALNELSFIEYHEATNVHLDFQKPLDHQFCLDGDASGEKKMNIHIEPYKRVKIMHR